MQGFWRPWLRTRMTPSATFCRSRGRARLPRCMETCRVSWKRAWRQERGRTRDMNAGRRRTLPGLLPALSTVATSHKWALRLKLTKITTSVAQSVSFQVLRSHEEPPGAGRSWMGQHRRQAFPAESSAAQSGGRSGGRDCRLPKSRPEAGLPAPGTPGEQSQDSAGFFLLRAQDASDNKAVTRAGGFPRQYRWTRRRMLLTGTTGKKGQGGQGFEGLCPQGATSARKVLYNLHPAEAGDSYVT